MSPWVYLTIAVLAEVTGTVALRESNGFTRPIPSVIVLVGYAIAFYLLAIISRRLELSIIYAVWSGAGIALLALIGVIALDERVSTLKIASLALIAAGIVGLNLAGTHR
jgi:small multidrug resistance pump